MTPPSLPPADQAESPDLTEPAGDRARAQTRRLLATWLPYIAFGGAILLVPAIFTRTPFYTMSNGVEMAILGIAALGLTLLTGFAGQISIGQAAFFGIGAYATAILVTREVPAVVAAAAGALISALVAATLGRFIFRVRGHYLALATLAFGLVLGAVSSQLSLTGAGQGISDIPSPSVAGFTLESDLAYYYLAAGVLFVAVVVARNVVRSIFGRSLSALGNSETAAACAGVDVAQRKRVTFVFAAVVASVAGSIYAHWITFVDYHAFDLLLSLQLLIMATVGGLRSIWGAPVGAFVVVTLSQAASDVLPMISSQAGGETEIVAYGIALIAVLLFLPRGLAGSVEHWVRERILPRAET